MLRNSFSIVEAFEKKVAAYAGARYAVAVDCCTNAIFLSLKYVQHRSPRMYPIVVPARTYVSVPMACIHAGYKVIFTDYEWRGAYTLAPAGVVDGAKRFRPGMYEGGLHCLSFHAKKIVNIGRGGMILTDDEDADDWLRRARYDGREGLPYDKERVAVMGWHFYMTPEQAARGMQIMETLPPEPEDLTEDYPDLRTFPVFAGQMAAAA